MPVVQVHYIRFKLPDVPLHLMGSIYIPYRAEELQRSFQTAVIPEDHGLHFMLLFQKSTLLLHDRIFAALVLVFGMEYKYLQVSILKSRTMSLLASA